MTVSWYCLFMNVLSIKATQLLFEESNWSKVAIAQVGSEIKKLCSCGRSCRERGRRGAGVLLVFGIWYFVFPAEAGVELVYYWYLLGTAATLLLLNILHLVPQRASHIVSYVWQEWGKK